MANTGFLLSVLKVGVSCVWVAALGTISQLVSQLSIQESKNCPQKGLQQSDEDL